MSRADIGCKCTRRRNKHMESERKVSPVLRDSMQWSDLVCPKCSCKSFYEIPAEEVTAVGKQRRQRRAHQA